MNTPNLLHQLEFMKLNLEEVVWSIEWPIYGIDDFRSARIKSSAITRAKGNCPRCKREFDRLADVHHIWVQTHEHWREYPIGIDDAPFESDWRCLGVIRLCHECHEDVTRKEKLKMAIALAGMSEICQIQYQPAQSYVKAVNKWFGRIPLMYFQWDRHCLNNLSTHRLYAAKYRVNRDLENGKRPDLNGITQWPYVIDYKYTWDNGIHPRSNDTSVEFTK